MKADLHIHTHHSPCSDSNIKNILKRAQRQGFSDIAITDHNTIKGALEAKKKNPYPDLNIIIGCEKKCEYGELLIYDLEEEIKGKKFVDIIKQAREQNAKVFIAHPRDFIRFPNMWKNMKLDVVKSVDGLEIYNGRNVFNKLGKSFAKEHKLKGVAGSDSHFVEEIGSTYLTYNNSLWDDVMNGDVKFYHNNPIFRKLKYLIKSFIKKRL